MMSILPEAEYFVAEAEYFGLHMKTSYGDQSILTWTEVFGLRYNGYIIVYKVSIVSRPMVTL